MKVYELTPVQQKAFNKLKKAANDCKKLNIGFVNLYGTITPYDKGLICDFGFDTDFEISCIEHGYPSNCISNLGGDSYADDQLLHYFKLTPKGKRVFNQEIDDY